MGKPVQSLIAGAALLVVAGVLFLERGTAPDEAAASGPALAVNHLSPGSGKSRESGEPRSDGSTGNKDKYYFPSSGHRTVPDEVNGLLAADGNLTDQAALYFGLDGEKRSQVNSLMKSKLEEESRRIATRAVPVPGTPGNPDARAAWEIHALKDRGRQFWEGLYQDLPPMIGAGHVESFVAAMNDRSYGGFGRLDGRIRILSKEGEGLVDVEWSDPVSGTKADGGTMNFREFDARYGTAFRLEHATEFSPAPEP